MKEGDPGQVYTRESVSVYSRNCMSRRKASFLLPRAFFALLVSCNCDVDPLVQCESKANQVKVWNISTFLAESDQVPRSLLVWRHPAVDGWEDGRTDWGGSWKAALLLFHQHKCWPSLMMMMGENKRRMCTCLTNLIKYALDMTRVTWDRYPTVRFTSASDSSKVQTLKYRLQSMYTRSTQRIPGP